MRSAALIAVLAVAIAAGAATAPAAGPLPGVPTGDSLLFSLGATSGSLHGSTLTLRGLDRQATWFSDRPRRDAGLVHTSTLLQRWSALGFRASPPNAVLIVEGAPRSRDSVAIELRLRRAGGRRATFAVSKLAGVGAGLRKLADRLDRRVATRFRRAALFIDNADAGSECTLGQPELFAGNVPVGGRSDTTFAPADGSLLKVSQYTALFSLYGNAFGGDLQANTFGLPKVDAPPGMTWGICMDGMYPSRDDLGDCVEGELQLWTMPQRGATFYRNDPHWKLFKGTLPSPAPTDFVPLVCATGGEVPNPYVAQVDTFDNDTVANNESVKNYYVPADGRLLSIRSYQIIYALVGTKFGGDGMSDFALPVLGAPQGYTSLFATAGVFPQ